MKLNTKYGGEVIINPDNIIHFPSGIPGFEEEKEFVLMEMSSIGAVVFQVLQSTNTPALAFIVIDPYVLTNTYEFRLDDAIIERIQLDSKEDVRVRSIVTVKSPFEESTLNLKGPIIINKRKKIGRQFIIENDTYATKTPLSSFVQSEAKGDS